MSIVDATVRSVNAAYARLEIQYLGKGTGTDGSEKVASVARKLGISFPTESELKERCGKNYNRNGGCTPADNVPAIALGAKEVSPLEMAAPTRPSRTTASTRVRRSSRRSPTPTARCCTRRSHETHRAVSSATARGVSHVLQQVVQRGTGRAAALDRPVAGKTGTSQEWRDAWFDGYIPQLATVAWVGTPSPSCAAGAGPSSR